MARSGCEKKLLSLRSPLFSLSPWHARPLVQAELFPSSTSRNRLIGGGGKGEFCETPGPFVTTEEERRLGQGTFRPYQAKEIVTGLVSAIHRATPRNADS